MELYTVVYTGMFDDGIKLEVKIAGSMEWARQVEQDMMIDHGQPIVGGDADEENLAYELEEGDSIQIIPCIPVGIRSVDLIDHTKSK